jgi:hypothetical protein
VAEVELPKPEELEEVMSHKFTRRVALIAAMFGSLLCLNEFFLLVRLPFLSH